MPRRVDDPLHALLCHTIRLCWKSLRGQQVLKNVQIDQDLASWALAGMEGMEAFTPRRQITNTWACGSSANRLCEILTGSQLNLYTGNTKSPDVILLSEPQRLGKALEAMDATNGYFMLRINVLAQSAGHSYIFLSEKRHRGTDLKGYIYQTNVGCHKDSAFDLIDWIDDPKSEVEVDLKTYFQNLVEGFNKSPAATYQKEYMLSDKQLRALGKGAEEPDLKKMKGSTGDSFCMEWRAVVEAAASTRLRAICETVPQPLAPAKKHANVANPQRMILTSG
jgi:hypothetical protein